jgi:hypothetical protein
LLNVLFAVAAIFYSYKACADTGWLFGWLIGASKSGRTKDGLAEGVRVRNDNASEQAADRPPMKLADDQPAAKQESAK